MKWGTPNLLYLLLLLAPLGWGLLALARRRNAKLAKIVASSTWAALIPGWRPERLAWRIWVWLAAAALLFVAAARPQWGIHREEVRRRGLDIMLCIDTSRSMLAEDIKPNRIEQAKYGVRDMLKQLKGDRAGLIAFAGAAFLECPLTIDYSAFSMMLDDVRVGVIPRGGTAIGEALRTAMDSFEKRDDADKAIILITDGDDTEGDPLSAIDELKERDIRVFAIGVGTQEGTVIPITDDQGRHEFLKDNKGQVINARLGEGMLRELALQTGGAYVRAAPGDLGLDQILNQQLSRLKRSQADSKTITTHEDRFAWFIAAALLLLAIEAFISDRVKMKEART